jgi:hypothetical protein
MKKFRTWYDRIEDVEVIHETAKFVTEADGQRWAKRNDDFRNYFDTWQEAKDFLIDREKDAIIKLTTEIKQRQETLQKIEEMQQP